MIVRPCHRLGYGGSAKYGNSFNKKCVMAAFGSFCRAGHRIDLLFTLPTANHGPHHRWWLEDNVDIFAPAFRAHETASEPSQREVPTLGPYERLHVQDRLVAA
jgi:hypothetical protein